MTSYVLSDHLRCLSNKWDFPGGKVEKDEDIYSALEREILEELGCKVKTNNEVFNDYLHEYDSFMINLITIKCEIVEGSPVVKEHSKLIWLKRENIESLQWTPADLPAVNQLINDDVHFN